MNSFKKTFFVFVFISLWLADLIGQTPGYMGKKTNAGYGFYVNPALTAALIDYGTKIINTQHEFFIERAIKNGLSIGLSARLFKSTYNNTRDVDFDSQTYQHIGEDISPRSHYDIKGRNFAFYGKFFKRRYIAPWGRYFLLGVTYNTYTTNYNPNEMYVPILKYIGSNGWGINENFSDFGPTEQRFTEIDILIGNGRSRVLWDKIVLDYGYNLGLVSTTLVLFDAFDDARTTNEDYIENTSRTRIRGINRFNFFAKLSYLF